MDNSKLRCGNQEREMKKINKEAIGEKKEEMLKVESNQGSQ